MQPKRELGDFVQSIGRTSRDDDFARWLATEYKPIAGGWMY